MVKKIDKVLLNILLFAFLFSLCRYITGRLSVSAISAVLLTVAINLTVKIFSGRKPENTEKFVLYLKNCDKRTKLELIARILPSKLEPVIFRDRIITADGKFVFECYNYDPLGKDDFLKLLYSAYSEGAKQVYFFGNPDTVELKSYPFSIVSADVFFSQLKKNGLLPDAKENPVKPGLKTVLKSALNRKNAKYFLFSGFVTALLGFFTPLKLYYLIFSGISLLLSVVSFFFPVTKKKADLFE